MLLKRKFWMTEYSRRTFLKNSLSAAAFALAGCNTKQMLAYKPGSQMRFGLVTYLWGRDWPVPTLIANCEKTHFLGVELRTEHAHGVEPSLTKAQRKKVKKRFSDSPVTLVGLGRNECFDNPDPDILKKNIETAKGVIKLSHDIGATGVKVKPNDFHKNVPKEKTIEQIGRALNTLGRFAADYNQQIRLEVHGSCSSLPSIRAIMDIAYHPNVTVCWNSNEQDLLGRGLEFNFNLVKDRFGDTAHVRELNIGKYPYQQLINLFVKIDYPGWILLEAISDPPGRIKALAQQRDIFEKMRAEAQKSPAQPPV
jgi:sugar phosphate isomerase/epimerase